MKIEEYVKLRPIEGTRDGVMSPWLDFCSVELPSGKLLLADPAFYPDGMVTVDLQPGAYLVQITFIDLEGHRHVARLRVTNDTEVEVAEPLGEVSVEFAELGVVDEERMRQVREPTLEEMEALWNSQDPYALYGTVPWDTEKGIEMPYVKTGFGDGVYTVRELRSAGLRVGVEVDFLEDIDLD